MKLDRPICWLDLEATETNPETARVTEIAMFRRVDGNTKTIDKLVNPETHIPRVASLVSGIYDDDVASAPLFVEIAHEAAELLMGATPAGFNITNYDLPLLEAEFARAGLELPFRLAPPLDVRLLFFGMEPFAKVPNHTLAAAHEFYLSRTIEGAHRAMSDVRATRAVFAAMLDRYGWHEKTLDQIVAEATRDFVDPRGLLRRRAGLESPVLAFGSHKGRTVAELVELEPSYTRWASGISPELAAAFADARGTR